MTPPAFNEFEDLEQRLRNSAALPQTADLRRRVLQRVADYHSISVRPSRAGHFAFAAAVAAAMLLAVNLTIIAASVTTFTPAPGNLPPIEQQANLITQLLPDLSPADARREAILDSAAGRLLATPQLNSSAITQQGILQ